MTTRRHRMTALLFALLCLWAPALSQAPQNPPAKQKEEEPAYNPYLAERNLQIGAYYLKTGKYDAAIERLKDSIRYKPNYAKPHLLLAQAYEKKGEKAEALAYYRKYLEILPRADNAAKIQKRIAHLEKELAPAGPARKPP